MAIKRRTKEEREQARQDRSFQRDVKSDTRRSKAYNNKRERVLGRTNDRIEKREGRTPSVPNGVKDPGVKGKSITTVMKQNDVGPSIYAVERSFGPSVAAYSNTASQEEVGNAVRTQVNYKISKGEIDDANINAQANSVPTAGMQLASAVANDPNATLTDLNKLSEAATVVNNAQNQQDAAIADEAIATNNALNETPDDEVPVVGAEGGAGGGGAGATGNTSVGGDGSMLNQQVQGGTATFDQGMTRGKIQNQVSAEALKNLSSSPVLAIEKLGVQDYFPNAGESINVGSYSGKYIGNTTIFAAPGARVPFGLYDARMRALKEAAAEKQKIVDKMLTAPQTAAQNQEQYNNEYFFPRQNGFIEKHNGDFNAMMSDPEYRQFMATAEAKARDITQTATWAKTMADSYQKKDVYIPKEMMDDIEKILYGNPEEFSAYLNGENNSYGRALNNAKPYLNVMPQVEELMKTVTAPDRLTERPFDFKTGGKYDDPDFVAGRNKFMERVMNGDPSLGADVYASGIIKYFDVADIEQSISAMIAGQDGSEKQLPSLLSYAAGMIPKESIKFSYETIKTDELEWNKHYQHIKEWNKEQQDKDMSFAATLDGGAGDAVNPKTNKTFNQEISALVKSGLTGTARQKKLEEIYGVYMGSMSGSTVKTDKNGTIFTSIPLPDIKAVQGDPNKRTYTVTYIDMDKKRVERNMTAAEIARVAPNVKLSIGGKAIESNSDFATIMEKPVSSEERKAFYDRNNKLQYLNGDNTDEYDKALSGRKITFQTEKLQTYIVKTGKNADGEPYQYYEAIPGQIDGNIYNISNASGQQMFDDRVGFNAWQAAQVQGGGEVTTSSGSTTPR